MMARKKSAGAALAGARGHLSPAGENADADQEKGTAHQGDDDAGAGDKPGERTAYQLHDEARAQLGSARALDAEAETDLHEIAFWQQLGDELDFIPSTVEAADDVIETGDFTAWPDEPTPPAFNVATNEADHNAGVERIGAMAETAELAAATLGGDLRDAMLDIFRNRHKPWPAMSPDEQRDVAAALDYAVKIEIRRATRLIAAEGRNSIPASLEKYADKGGEITATIKISAATDETILALHRASGHTVLIVSADADAHLGERAPVQIDRVDPELEFDAGRDPPPADDSDLAGPRAADVAEQNDEAEALYARAVEAVRQQDNTSVSWLQRTLGIGYNLAGQLIERMESDGIVTPADVTTKRQVIKESAGDSGDHGDDGAGPASGAAETA